MSPTSNARTTRINARLDEEHSMTLAFLKRTTQLGVSDIVKKGIDLLYEGEREQRRNPLDILSETGFLGSGAGPSDLSERTKDELTESLEAKFGPR